MPRRYNPPKRKVEPDPRYSNIHVSMFINRMMTGGKKSTARGLFYEAMDLIAERTKKDPVEIFEQAIKNASPVVEVKPRRVGGSTYQVPIEVEPFRRATLAMRWLLAGARSRSGRGTAEKLAAELMDAQQGQGNAVKKKDDTHRMAEANKTFAHYRW